MLLGRHVGVGPIVNWHVGLLDVLGRDPAEQVMRRSGFVVCTRHASTSKGLLTHDGTSALIIDVQIAGRILETIHRLFKEFPINKDIYD